MSEIKRKIGRPPKNELSSNLKRNVVGRPKGDAAIINEYKSRMLSSPKSRKVLDAIFDAALDNEHKKLNYFLGNRRSGMMIIALRS